MKAEPKWTRHAPNQLCDAEKEFEWGTVRCERPLPHIGPHLSLDTPHEKGVARWGDFDESRAHRGNQHSENASKSGGSD